MKKILSVIGIGLIIIICVPIALIVFIGYLLYVPFDIIRYHRMPYYKDFKTKYVFFITSRDIVRLYNRIVRERLPIEYVKNDDFEFFVKDGQVLLCGWSYDEIEQVDGEWFFVFNGEENITMSMQEVLEDDINRVKAEHSGLPAKFLFFYNDIEDIRKIEEAKKCPYFYGVYSVDKLQ